MERLGGEITRGGVDAVFDVSGTEWIQMDRAIRGPSET